MATRPTSFDIGRVFERAFRSVRTDPLPIVVIALVLGGLPQLGVDVFQRSIGTVADPGSAAFFRSFGELMIVSIISGLFSTLGAAMILPIGLAGVENRRADIGAAISGAFVKFPLLFVMSWVSAIGLFFGMILLIVPGVILAVMWVVAPPVMILEDRGVFGSLGRSAELTKGSRWAIFAILLIFWVVMLVGMTTLGGGLGFAAGASRMMSAVSMLQIVLGAVGGAVMLVAINALYVAIYSELRDVKEGGTEQALSDVFA